MGVPYGHTIIVVWSKTVFFDYEQKSIVLGGWVGGWMDGRKSRSKDCLQQSKITNESFMNVPVKKPA